MADERYEIDNPEQSGTFFELIEFSLVRDINGAKTRGAYGVNVAKVREVVRMPQIVPVATKVQGLAGLFELRGVPIPAINLAKALGDNSVEYGQDHQIIVTEFSRKRAGFIVEQTKRIRRITWDKVLPPAADGGSCMSGMTLIENNKFLFILDLEKILIDLEAAAVGSNAMLSQLIGGPIGNGGIGVAGMGAVSIEPPPSAPGLLLVDDSSFVRNSIKVALKREGFRVVTAENGKMALEMLERYARGDRRMGRIDAVVTDVEMPQMNGLMLTQKIREHAQLAAMPVILHTSLSGQANYDAGIKSGASGYVIKNDLRSLFDLLRDLLSQVA